MKMTPTAPILGLAVALLGAAAYADTALTPGYYETHTRMPGETKARVFHDCLTPEEARTMTVERRIFQAAKGDCAYSQRQVGGGKFALAGTCVNDDGSRTRFNVTGSYSAISMAMTLASTTTVNGKPMAMDMGVSLRRVAAACPAGSR